MTGVPQAASVLEPWDDPGFRAGLALLAQGSREASRRVAAEAGVLAALADRVPRVRWDESGATAWTSFLREVAVARRCSDLVARSEVAFAQQLRRLPRTAALLAAGELALPQARALVEESWPATAETLVAIDAGVSERACRLACSRVRDAVRKVLVREQADAIADEAARAVAARQVRRTPLSADQAEVAVTGPAAPLAQAWQALDGDARALRAAGDGRTLDALRFDLAVDRLLGEHVSRPQQAPGAVGPAGLGGATSPAGPAGATCPAGASGPTGPDGVTSPAGAPVPRPATGGPAWLADRRWSRPVRLNVTVPVTTLLGLVNEPGWLDGHGWLSAPTCRQLLVSAELRRLCVQERTGRLVELTEQVVRPILEPAAVAAALRDMASVPCEIGDTAWRAESEHDPGERLREFVVLRDGLCDGPTGARVQARRAQLDHEDPWPQGPTAAWNLVARGARTHLLKHRGWTPVRTPTSTLWFSPAGQVVEVEHASGPAESWEDDAVLPDPVELHALEAEFLRPSTPDDTPPDW